MKIIKTINSKINKIFLFIISQILLIQNSYAMFATPASSDMSREFLNQIFGSLLDGGVDAFGSSIATFNGAVLIVGGILVAYTIFAGTLGTAHDGEMLGKKFSSVWIPIRTSMGTALILPILPGGYCVMQGIVMWLVMQGVSLGNMVWSAYMSNPAALSTQVGSQSKDAIRKLVEDIYAINVCLSSKAQAYTDAKSGGGNFLFSTYDYQSKLADGTYSFGDQHSFFNKSNCGKVILPKAPSSIAGNTTTATTNANLSSLSSLTTVFQPVDTSPIYQAHLTATAKVISDTKALADANILSGTGTYTSLEPIINTYITTLSSANAAPHNAPAANQQGWFLAGTWATVLINQQNKVHNAISGTSQVQINISPAQHAMFDNLYKYNENGFSALKDKRDDLTDLFIVKDSVGMDGANAYDGGSSSANAAEPKSSPYSAWGSLSSAITKGITGLDISDIKTDQRHPLIIMSTLGNRMLNSIMASVGVVAILAAVVGVWSSGVTLAMAIGLFLGFAAPILAFQGIAGMLAFILPNTPLFIWIGIIIGWTLMVIEAILAAPLWAVMHLHPNGDEMTGKGSNGYMLVLGLVLRPALIIFGLIAAIILSELFGKLLNIIFFDSFLSGIPDGELGFMAVIFGTGLYAGLMMLIIKNSFAIMHTIPDQLMRWIGGGSEQLGQYANQMSEGSLQKGAAIGGAAAGLLTDKVMSNAGQGLQNVLQQKKTDQGTKAQEKGNKIAEKSSIDGKLGSGMADATGSMKEGKEKQSDKQSLDNQQAIHNANNAFGGVDSLEAENFRSNLQEEQANNPNSSFQENYDNAMNKTLSDAFGPSAPEVAKQFAQEKGATPGSETSSPAFRSVIQGLMGKENNLMEQGSFKDDARNAISGMLSDTAQSFKQGNGSVKISSILGKNSTALNDSLGYSSGKKSETAAAPLSANPPEMKLDFPKLDDQPPISGGEKEDNQ